MHAPTRIHTHARAEVSTLEDTFEGEIGSSGTDIIGRGLAPCSSMEAPASRAFVLDTLLARTMRPFALFESEHDYDQDSCET